MSLGDSIKVGPWLQGYVRVSREGSFEESQRRWPRLRKVLVRYGGEHEPWQNRKDPYSTSDGEKFIDVAMEEDWRPALVADLEAAGFDVIDDVGQTAPRHPYRESKSMKITAGQLRRIISEEVSRVLREIVVDPEGIDRDYSGLGAPPCDHCGSDNTFPEESTPSMMGYGDDQSWTCGDCGGVTYSIPLGRHSMR